MQVTKFFTQEIYSEVPVYPFETSLPTRRQHSLFSNSIDPVEFMFTHSCNSQNCDIG